MLTISSLIPFFRYNVISKILFMRTLNYKYLVISQEIFEKNPLAYITFVFILIISFATIFKLLVLKLNLKSNHYSGIKNFFYGI